MDNNWEMHAQQQQSRQHHQQQPTYQQRSQSMSIPASQFSNSAQYSPSGDYSQHHNYDRRHPSAYPTPIPPLQVNPSSFAHSDVPPNLPSSSLPGGPQQPLLTRNDRHRTQSVALTSIGQREQGYASSGYSRMAHRSNTAYGSEATVPISRHTHASGAASSRQWASYQSGEPLPPPVEPQVPYISSAMSQYQHQPIGVPSRQMPPLSELDRRTTHPADEPAQPRPKPHVCEQCGAAFSRAHDLKRHVETHKGDRPHKCPTCTKAFSRKDALQRHQSMAQCGVDPQEYQ